MIISEYNLSKEKLDKLKLFLGDNNISFISSEQAEHIYHRAAKSEYNNAVEEMNNYNGVILNLLVLASCGEDAPEFTFKAVVNEAFDGKKEYKEFSLYELEWDDKNADRGMKSITPNLYNFLSFDADLLSEDDEFKAKNEFENFVKVF